MWKCADNDNVPDRLDLDSDNDCLGDREEQVPNWRFANWTRCAADLPLAPLDSDGDGLMAVCFSSVFVAVSVFMSVCLFGSMSVSMLCLCLSLSLSLSLSLCLCLCPCPCLCLCLCLCL